MDAAAAGEDPYEVLGVPFDASPDMIRRAYRRRALAAHPDVRPGQEGTFKRLAEAYEVLGDETRRREYDRSIARVASPGSPVAGPTAVRRAPDPSGDVPPARRPERIVVRVPPPVAAWQPTVKNPDDEWRSAGLVLRAVAVLLIVAILGVAILIVGGSHRGPGDPPAERPFCKTPDGWVDCRVLDPLSQY